MYPEKFQTLPQSIVRMNASGVVMDSLRLNNLQYALDRQLPTCKFLPVPTSYRNVEKH
jgi:hypothetical protein